MLKIKPNQKTHHELGSGEGHQPPGSPGFQKALGAAGPPPAHLRGRSAPPRRRPRRSPRGDLRGCWLTMLLPMWKLSQKRWQERRNLQTEKCQQRGERRAEGNRLKGPAEDRQASPRKMGKPRRKVQPRMTPSLMNIVSHVVSSVVLSPSSCHPEEQLCQLFCKYKVFNSSRNIFKKGEIF